MTYSKLETSIRSVLAVAGLSAMAGVGYAQQPPDSVQSDAYANTAMGLNALLDLSVPSGEENTAAGAYALENNTTASHNSAYGWAALYDNSTGTYNTAFGAGALEWNTT